MPVEILGCGDDDRVVGVAWSKVYRAHDLARALAAIRGVKGEDSQSVRAAACSWSCLCAVTDREVLVFRDGYGSDDRDVTSSSDEHNASDSNSSTSLHLLSRQPIPQGAGSLPRGGSICMACQSSRVVLARRDNGSSGGDEGARTARSAESALLWATLEAEQFGCKAPSPLSWHHVHLPTRVKQVSCGKIHTLLLDVVGEVWSWGSGALGQLGHGAAEDEGNPRRLEALQGMQMKSVAAGGWHSLVLSSSGDVYSFGRDNYGQLGRDTIDTSPTDPGLVDICVNGQQSLENVTVIACGSAHSLAVTHPGQAFGWGWAEHGQLGEAHASAPGGTVSRPALIPLPAQCAHVHSSHSSWMSVFEFC